VAPAGAAQAGWAAWRTPLLIAAGTVLALRVVLGLWAAFVLARFPINDLPTLYEHVGFPLQGTGWVAPWEREDALWYEKIAVQGYSTDGTTTFFPLLPLLMRLVNLVTGNIATAGVVVGTLTAIIAFALLYRLIEVETDPATAGRTLAYTALFPTAFFFYSGFTESLFLALAVGGFWAVRAGRWPLAVLLVALAGLTRFQGALIGLPLALEYVRGRALAQSPTESGLRKTLRAGLRDRRAWGPVAALIGAGVLATGAFFAYITYVVHDPLSYSQRQLLSWGHYFTWPGEVLAVAAGKVAGHPGLNINTFDFGVALGFTALAVVAFRYRASYGLYALIILAGTWVHTNNVLPLMSISRYVLVAFPCFLVLARWAGGRPRWVHLAIITLWLSWLLIWTLQSVLGFWVG
jgi:hypothetical protein